MRKQALAVLALLVPVVIAGAALWVNADPVEQPAGEEAAYHGWTAQEATYEGGRSGCRRCHLAEYRSWERTPHANAYETLPEESRGDANCVKCHVTGYAQPTGFTSLAETPELASVGCEVCHGPGSFYKAKEVMEDRDAALAAGMKIPNQDTCIACHNSESPTFPGSFDFEEMKAAGVHEIG